MAEWSQIIVNIAHTLIGGYYIGDLQRLIGTFSDL